MIVFAGWPILPAPVPWQLGIIAGSSFDRRGSLIQSNSRLATGHSSPRRESIGSSDSVGPYQQNADDLISANFGKFAAALDPNSDEMDLCYMSEINLGDRERSSLCD